MKKLTAILLMAGVSGAMASPLSDWFGKEKGKRGEVPALEGASFDSPEAIEATKKKVWQAYADAADASGWKKSVPEKLGGMDLWVKGREIQPLVAELGDKKMLYVVLAKGEKPENGWPVFISMHGGGRNDKAPGPHAWQVNTREWFAQMRLFESGVYESPGIYIIPRMADDREGRWFLDYNQDFVDQMIQRAILYLDADPNRVYFQGISEGGYAAFHLGSFMADRWAGSCGMAAAVNVPSAPPENLRHVAFRCAIGENDKMFNRDQLARDYDALLGALAEKNPGYYVHSHDEQKGRGHGIDYREGPKWIYQYTRKPAPKRIDWTLIKRGSRTRERSYWLALDTKPDLLPLKLTAEVVEGNVVEITSKKPATKKNDKGKVVVDKEKPDVVATGLDFRVYLDNRLVDLSKPVTIKVNGKQVFQGEVKRSVEAIARSTAERGDPEQVYTAMVKVKS